MPDPLYGFCRTDFWDLKLTWYTERPDFTPCFQNTVLLWVPFGFLLLFIPYEMYTQKKYKEGTIPWNVYNVLKLICTLALFVIEIVKLIWLLLYMGPTRYSSPAVISSPIISLLGYMIVGLMIITGRKNGIQSSFVLFYFWLFQLLGVIIPYYSKILRLINEPDVDDVTLLGLHLASTPLVLLQLLLTFIPDQLPATKHYTTAQNICPEKSSSQLSQLLFGWLDSLVISGYRSPLKQKELWNLEHSHQSNDIVNEFDYQWNRQIENAKKSGWDVTNKSSRDAKGVQLPSLPWALWKTYWPTFAIATVQLVVADLLTFVNPMILDLIISFVSSNEPLWKGVLYAFTVFLTSELRSLLLSQYYLRMFVAGMKIRVSIVASVYRKALLLSNKERQESTIGEIVNLMSIDTQKFVDLMPYMLMIVSAPIQIVIALYMLSQVLGIAIIAGIVVMLLMGPANALVASLFQRLQTRDMLLKDERTKLITELLDGIKVLKLYAWEIPFGNIVQKIRNKEIKVIKKIAYIMAFFVFLWTCAPVLVSLSSFATFVLIDKNNVLTANVAFVSTSLFDLLRAPLNLLPTLLSFLVQVYVSVKRLNKFLRGEELDPSVVTHHDYGNNAVVVEDGTFAWGGQSEKPTLSEIDLTVPTGQLVAVVGQVGSGKSSLISSILGELNKRKGKINVQGSLAYVPQQAWIQNATVKDNILMYKEFEGVTYEKILDACALRSDLEILPGGDLTEIGEKGINLSGGQKQRVSLARAVYRESDVYLLDDPLSAVDSHVGKHIFDKVIGPSGLLSSTTRIFVTNSISYLPVCDAVVVLKDGVISEMGTYQELLMKKGAFSDFLNQYLSQKAEELDDEDMQQLDEILSKVPVSPDVQRQISRKASASESESVKSRTESLVKRRKSSVRASDVKTPTEKTEKNKLIQEETMELSSVNIGVYVAYVREIGWFVAFLVVLMFMGYQGSSLGANVWLSEWSNDPVLADGTVDPALRDMRLGVYGALGVSQGLLLMLGALGLAYGAMRAAENLHNKMLDCVLKAPMSFFDTTPIGRIVNRFSKDVNITDFLLMLTIRMCVMTFMQVVAVIIIDTVKTPMILIPLVPASILYYFVQRVYIATSRQLKRLESVTRSPIYNHFKESIAGSASIRAYGVQDIFINESNARVDNNMTSYYPSVAVSRWLAVRLEFVGSIIVMFAVLFAVLSRDVLDPGSVGLSVSYAMTITAALTEMVRSSSDVETNIVSVERILEYSRLQPEAVWDNDYNKSNASWPATGQVSFNSYSTKYREDLDPVLKGINCNIQPGEKIGICGRTGAGKSSLTLALFRIIEATGGSITIDNIDIAKLGLHNLRSRLTIIPQDPVLFSGTLRQNLDPFETTDDKDIWSALEHAHLKTFTSGLTEGLDFVVAEGGENLSVGQRQLICLARALLRNTKILILDEATAAVDLETDDLIQATIRKEFANSTILTIAHRLNTIMDSTRILVLDQGKIAEFDTPKNLLDDKKSIFYGMAEDAGLI